MVRGVAEISAISSRLYFISAISFGCNQVRAGVEYLEIEITRDGYDLQQLIISARRAGVRLIGSHHTGGAMPAMSELTDLLSKCALGGAASAVKMTTTPSMSADVTLVGAAARSLDLNVPCIALADGPMAKMSQLLNIHFTPVTHTDLANSAICGEFSAEELINRRRELGYAISPHWTFYFARGTFHICL